MLILSSLYLCLTIPTFVFWPLPLLHGRKPYTLGALALLIPLQIPQALAVSVGRSPYVSTYRVALLLARGLSGLILGFANINFKTTLLDLFGSSLQSGNPHQEILNEDDVRRHGGGMGVWLGIWSCCFIGSVGVEFLIGASIINNLNPSWGFWIILITIAIALVLNVVTPEVRRSPYRRSVAQVVSGTTISRRVARGEVMMHIKSTGPIWWWEEVHAGLILSWNMLKQPGFAILSIYMGWIYGQMVMVVVVSSPSALHFPRVILTTTLATRCTHLEVLPLSISLRRALCCCCAYRRGTGCPVPKSFSLQSLSTSSSSNG